MGAEESTSGDRIPMLLFVVLALLLNFLFSMRGSEPYPSIMMPGFAAVTPIDDPDDVGIRHLVVYQGEARTVLDQEDLFDGAPLGQRAPMAKVLDSISGTEEQWIWIDSQVVGPPADAAEMILLNARGKFRVISRIDRLP